VLRGIFGPKKDEVTAGWRTLHNEELSDLYSSSDIIILIMLDAMCKALSTNGDEEESCMRLMEKPEEGIR
jgi:hypothetical protein